MSDQRKLDDKDLAKMSGGTQGAPGGDGSGGDLGQVTPDAPGSSQPPEGSEEGPNIGGGEGPGDLNQG